MTTKRRSGYARWSAVPLLVPLICSFLSRSAPARTASDLPTPTLSDVELGIRLRRQLSKINAFEVEYQSVPDSVGIRPGLFVHRLIAAQSPSCFYEAGFHGNPSQSWADDPDQQSLLIVDGIATSYFMFERRCKQWPVPRESELPGSYGSEILHCVLGWWPTVGLQSPQLPNGGSESIRDAINRPEYLLTREYGKAEHRGYVVLEYPKHDKMWLDPDRGFTLVARQILNPDSGAIIQRLEMSNFKELSEGIWMPFEFRNLRYDNLASKSPTMNVVTRILDGRLNDQVDRRLFQFNPKPGSIRVFDDGSFNQIAKGGTNYIETLSTWTQRTFPRSVPSRRGILEMPLEIVITISTLIGAVFVRIKRAP